MDGAMRMEDVLASPERTALDVVDAAFHDPVSRRVYFFRGDRYVEYRPGRGVVARDGRTVRRLGIDGWAALPDELRDGIDTAMYYAPDRAVHFFRGASYVVYAASGPVPLAEGRIVRRLGIDGWTALPEAFRGGIDAALHDGVRGRTLLFRGERCVEVGLDGSVAIVPLGRGGLELGAFANGIDAALDYPPNGKWYFFRGREYIRYSRDGGVESRYPVRIGSPYGRGLVRGKGGGWPGLSCLLAGPLVGPSTSTTVAIWVWAIDRATVDRLRVRVAGVSRVPAVRDLVDPLLRKAVDRVARDSQIVALIVDALEPGRSYEAALTLDDAEPVLDRIRFCTAQPPASHGSVAIVVGSCADMTTHADAPVFERMAEQRADIAILLGDNCYYVNHFGSSSHQWWRLGWLGAEWRSPRRMLCRQLAARNVPQLAALSRTTNLYATWDDHDFAYNNAAGHDRGLWVGRERAAAVFRAMWPGPHADGRAIYQAFRTGPVEVFITDTRYERDHRAGRILGNAQLRWLLDGLAASDAPVKIVVVSSQFLYRGEAESFLAEAPGERRAIVKALGLGRSPATVRGRVLVVSGDVHHSELLRAPTTGAVKLLELTSSSIRTGETGGHSQEWEPGSQVWDVKQDAFGVIRVDVRGCRGDAVEGTIALEARGATGDVLARGGRMCRTVWNLADGSLTTDASTER